MQAPELIYLGSLSELRIYHIASSVNDIDEYLITMRQNQLVHALSNPIHALINNI